MVDFYKAAKYSKENVVIIIGYMNKKHNSYECRNVESWSQVLSSVYPAREEMDSKVVSAKVNATE